jgi:hypothetical protein
MQPPRAGTLPALIALAASGAIGFHLGYARFPDWQIPVESAQVLAGVVTYPEETPFYIHHVTLWTMLHQVCAVLLRAGVGEIEASRLVSGLLGMLSLQALAMVTVAFSGRAILSTGVAVLLFVSGVTYAGAVYPVFLMGVPFTYGVVGLSLLVLVAGTFGSGLHRTSAFLLGLAPAVHTGLAIWLWIIVAVVLAIEHGRGIPRGAWRALLAGLTVSAASYAVHAAMAAGVPSDTPVMDRRYLDAFTSVWDGHRRPVELMELAVWLNVLGLLVATAWLRAARDAVSPAAATLLRFVQVSAALALLLVPLTWLPADRVPVPVLVLMPGRVLNIVAMALPAVLLGLVAGARHRLAPLLLLVIASALLAAADSMLWTLLARPGWIPVIPVHAITFVAGAIVLMAALAGHNRERANTMWLRAATSAVLIGAVAVAYRMPERGAHIFIDRTNNVVLAAAAAGPGLLLTTGDAHLMQLRTRRPMLVDTGALDTIPYSPGSGPVLDRILRDIYAVDLFDPPPEVRGEGRLLERTHKRAWEAYPSEKWREIRARYRVTQVLTPAGWQLDLPIAAGDRRYLLYRLPE